MWIFALLLILSHPFTIQCVWDSDSIALNDNDDSVDSNQANCGHNYQSNCLIVATFGNLLSNDSIDVFVNCTNDATLKYNQFSRIDKIIWNGCNAVRNLKFFGLRKITNRIVVQFLKIENFLSDTIEEETFDGFSQLENLSIERNSIKSLSAASFRGLRNLTNLQMIKNNLLAIGLNTLQSLPKLNALQITDEHLLMTNHQFSTNQIVNSVTLEIYYVEMDLMEHLFNHVSNLSISLRDDGAHGCEQPRFNGFEKGWIIEMLQMENFRCGFMMEDVGSLKNLQLTNMIMTLYDDEEDQFKLRNLKNLHALYFNHNNIRELSSIFDGDFTAIEILDLSFNKLSTIDISLFNLFPMLKNLNLSYNPITQLINIEELKFQIYVDYNSFDCGWLEEIVRHESFKWLNYTSKYENLNVNGLECSFSSISSSSTSLSFDINAKEEETRVKESFTVKHWNMAFIMCGSILLGVAVTFISIYAYNRSRLLKHQPFYHMLRESLIRPFSCTRDTLARDFKGIIFRNLPATNYEQPISSATEMTEVIEEGNIYEEIPEHMSG